MIIKQKLIIIFILAATSIATAAEFVKIANNASYGCRRSFGFGVYNPVINKTVMLWNGEAMSIYLRTYDHETGEYSEPALIRKLNYHHKWDYHNYPTIVIAPDDHYLVFYCRHVNEAFMLRSPRPHSIEGEWEHMQINNDKNAYPMPVTLGDVVFLFYNRQEDRSNRPYRFIKSIDNGLNWSRPKTVIGSSEGLEDGFGEVYVHGYDVDKQRNQILIAWEMKGGPGGHNAGGLHAWFAVFDVKTECMVAADGSNLGTCITWEEMKAHCMVAEGHLDKGNPFHYTTFPQLLPSGNPAIAYNFSGGTWLSKWTGSGWEKTKLPISGHLEKKTLYSYIRNNGIYRLLNFNNGTLEIWTSKNGVDNWVQTHNLPIPFENGANNITTGFFEQYHSSCPLMVSTFNQEERLTNYSGCWPVLILRDKHVSSKPKRPKPIRKSHSLHH